MLIKNANYLHEFTKVLEIPILSLGFQALFSGGGYTYRQAIQNACVSLMGLLIRCRFEGDS